jgi:hypothetical protein
LTAGRLAASIAAHVIVDVGVYVDLDGDDDVNMDMDEVL